MIPKTLLILLVAAAAIPALAQDSAKSANLQEYAKQIREGKIDVGKVYSTDLKKGRMHTIHVDALGVDCNTCHYGDRYREGVLLLRKYEFLPKRAQGQVDRSACLACHATGGIATTFYTDRAGEPPAKR